MMIVLVLLLVGLLIDVWDLLIAIWPFLVVAAGLGLLCGLVVLPAWDAQRREVHDRLRHERARHEIDRIALQTRRAMYEAALRHGDVIEGTAIEVKDR